jgi:RNA recognition motif-containing protein
VGNLSFDATSSDVTDLFADCEVTNVRIVEDKLTRVPKGFGYVEFASVEGLKKALTFSGTSLQGRGIRVSIAEPRTYSFTENECLQGLTFSQPRNLNNLGTLVIGLARALSRMSHAAGMTAPATTETSQTMSLKLGVSVASDDVSMRVMENLETLATGSEKALCHHQLHQPHEKVVVNKATRDQVFDEAPRLGAKGSLRMARGRRAASSKNDRSALSGQSVRQQPRTLTINGGQGCARMLLLLLLRNPATLHRLSRRRLLRLHDLS